MTCCAPSFSCHASSVYVPGRQPLQRHLAVLVRDAEERVVHDTDVGVHPAVDVALEGHHHFLRGEDVVRFHVLDRLAGIELRVALRQCVDVVERRIAVDDFERLADADAEDVRVVAAVLLINRHGSGRRVERVGAEAVLDVYEHVAEFAVGHLIGFLRLRRRVLLHADRIGAHLDRLVCRRCSLKRHDDVDVARGGRVDLLSGRGR